jgi:hypothetical protein
VKFGLPLLAPGRGKPNKETGGNRAALFPCVFHLLLSCRSLMVLLLAVNDAFDSLKARLVDEDVQFGIDWIKAK